MDENEVVKLDVELDSADLEKTLEKVTADTDALREMLEEIGAEIAKILSVLQKSVEKAAVSVELLTQALGKATEAVDSLIQSFSAEKLTAGLAEAGEQILGVVGDIAASIMGTIAGLAIEEYVKNNFSFRLQNIIDELGLLEPIYKQTASFGHFGRSEFPWEQIKQTKNS